MVKKRRVSILAAITFCLLIPFVSYAFAEIVFEDDFNDNMIDTEWTLVNADWIQIDEQNCTLNMGGTTDSEFWVTGGSATVDKQPTYLIAESRFRVDGSGSGYTATISVYDEWDVNSVELGLNSDPYIGGFWLRIAVNGNIEDFSLGPADNSFHTYRIKYDGNEVTVYLDGIPQQTFGMTLNNVKTTLHTNARKIGDSVYANFDYFSLQDFSVCSDFDLDKDGYSTENGDCDDNDPTVHPGVIEECDGKDNNCNGEVDENYDIDEDGFTQCGGDCNDNDLSINPASMEIPGNDTDENCDGSLGNCDPNADWKNHGEYVRCVAHEVEDLVNANMITQDEGDRLVSSAAQSEIGKN